MNSQPVKKAVAVSYSAERHEAPVIAAKGTGYVAEAIISKAQEHGVPVQEDRTLVELLSSIELNQQIPPELYQVVAEILAFVYRMDRKAGNR